MKRFSLRNAVSFISRDLAIGVSIYLDKGIEIKLNVAIQMSAENPACWC